VCDAQSMRTVANARSKGRPRRMLRSVQILSPTLLRDPKEIMTRAKTLEKVTAPRLRRSTKQTPKTWGREESRTARRLAERRRVSQRTEGSSRCPT